MLTIKVDLLFLGTDINGTQEFFNELLKTYTMTFRANATEYLAHNITRNEEEKTISLSQNGSILKHLDLFLPKLFTKTSCSPFLRTTVINED